MAETFYPLLIDPTKLNDGFMVVPDWNDNKIYTYNVSSGQSHLWASNALTGAAISDTMLAAICVISANTFFVSPNIVLGTDGANIYALTTTGPNNAARKANLRLSKINTGTLTETATAIPYAITNEIPEGYSIIGAGSWRLVAFQLNGVDYVALLLNGSDPANIEIFETATLTSVITFNYTTQNAGATWMVVGEQPTATSQKLYLMQEDPNVVDQQIGFVAVTFATTPAISDALLVNLLATDIDAAWTGANVNFVDTDPLDLMFDSKDSSLIFAVLNDVSVGPNLPPLTKLVKIDTTAGAVAWTIDVSNSIFALPNTQFAQSSILNDLSCCTLVFNDPNSNTFYTVTPADGASVSATSTHFDGTVADNGVRYPAVWDSVRQRLIYYYEGTNDLIPAWPFGGWAVWGPDGDLGCCTPPVALSARRWMAQVCPEGN